MYGFSYQRPRSIADAVAALASEEARPLAGGQTLIPTLKQRLARHETLVDLSGLAELKGVHTDGKAVGIGAMTTHAAVAASAEVRAAIPALAALAEAIGDPQVRNAGTIGGSLANNDPAADYPAAVLALGATIVTNKRNIAADDYFTGLFSTALEPGELITAVGFPVPRRAGYAKMAQRASRYALVGVFVAETTAGVRVAVTGAGGSGVYRSKELEAALASNFAAAALSGVTVPAGDLLSDLHASAEYRAALIPVIAERALVAAG
ncbi:MAG: FAD binding domain-containing protein [Hyphomicrobiaceae bacterium]|nr:FAD binding domain-containing protein [Hyphomicrobiaceae bacterium]